MYNKSFSFSHPSMSYDPFAIYSEMREYSPVFQVDGLWTITRYDDVKYALGNHKLFSSENCGTLYQPPWATESYTPDYPIILEDPPNHSMHKNVLIKHFFKKTIVEQIPFMRRLSQSLMIDINKKKSVEILEDFCYPYFGGIIKNLMNIDNENFERPQDMVHLLENPPLKPEKDYIKKLIQELDKQRILFENIIKTRKNQQGDNLITTLISADIEPAVISQMLEMLIISGYQTPVQTFAHTVIQLVKSPGLLARLREAPEQIPAFVEETLRFNSAMHVVFRRAKRAVVLSDVMIPEGAPVALVIAAANRDPQYFDHPEEFDITRPTNNRHLGFGYGIHRCLGRVLAWQQYIIAVESFVATFKNIECEVERIEWFYSMVSHGVRELPISVVSH